MGGWQRRAAETVFGLVPELLDHASSKAPPEGYAVKRFHEPASATNGHRLPRWGDPDHPLVYATFGSVAGPYLRSPASFARPWTPSLTSTCALMTVGRSVDPDDLRPLPTNSQVVAPLFSFDQLANGDHVASVGAGLSAGIGPGAVARAALLIPILLAEPTYADSARRVAAAMGELPPPAEAVPFLTGLVG